MKQGARGAEPRPAGDGAAGGKEGTEVPRRGAGLCVRMCTHAHVRACSSGSLPSLSKSNPRFEITHSAE